VSRLHSVLALAGASILLALIPAADAFAAGVTTSTTFGASASQTAVFGSDWVMPIVVAGTGQYPPPVDATSGTVSIVIEGQPGTYVSGIPLASGGQAFFSPPSAKPPLGAGTYKVTAIYEPGGGSGLSTSQTTTPAVLTITPISLSTSFTVQSVTIHNQPGAEVVAQVASPADKQTIPSGSWDITATNAKGTVAFEKKIPLGSNRAAVTTVRLTPGLQSGASYSISARFAPTATFAGGYTVTNGKAQQRTIAPKSLAETLSDHVSTPIWALVGIGLGFALLVAAAIVLIVRTRQQTGVPTSASSTVESAESTRAE
jgi:hypothetical protein